MSEDLNFEGWVSPREAAKLADISTDRVRQLIREGRLETVNTPLGRIISRRSVEQYSLRRREGGKKR